jgi:ribonuclease HI
MLVGSQKTKMKTLTYYVDGFTIDSNPSTKGGGYAIVNGENHVVSCVCLERTKFTNNEAELLGLHTALEVATAGMTVYTDSFCALAWVSKGKCKARPDLAKFAAEAQFNLRSKGIDLRLIPREKNLAGIMIENLKGQINLNFPEYTTTIARDEWDKVKQYV